MATPQSTFYQLLGNTLVASVTNNFVWFALTFWVFLETQSVLATSYVAGAFAVGNMLSALLFGTIVDHTRKKTAMLISSLVSLTAFVLGALLFYTSPDHAFASASNPFLWALIAILIVGSISGNLRMIALTTAVTLLFNEGRDKANGLIGVTNGISFALTSVLSGLSVGFLGMGPSLLIAVGASVVALLHLPTITLKEPVIVHQSESSKPRFDLKITLAHIAAIPGLYALIFFTTFNNFLGGVFMALMDAYGLSLMSVKAWGILLAIMSVGFILGSSIIAKFGLGENPVSRLLLINVITWTTCIFFTIQPSIILLAVGMIIWMTLFPFVEATENTIIQNLVPYERQGRVIGFAHSVESAATPLTAFLIGPIAQWFFIPFMTTGAGALLIGSWFGTGPARGIALVFVVAGTIGLLTTLMAFRTRSYQTLSTHYRLAVQQNTAANSHVVVE